MCRFHSPDGFVLAASSRTGFRISLFAPMPFLPMPLPISFKAGEGNLLGTANAHREDDADSGGGHSVARGRDVRALPFLHPQPSFTCGKSELLLVFPPFTCSEELVPTAGGSHTSFAGYSMVLPRINCASQPPLGLILSMFDHKPLPLAPRASLSAFSGTELTRVSGGQDESNEESTGSQLAAEDFPSSSLKSDAPGADASSATDASSHDRWMQRFKEGRKFLEGRR